MTLLWMTALVPPMAHCDTFRDDELGVRPSGVPCGNMNQNGTHQGHCTPVEVGDVGFIPRSPLTEGRLSHQNFDVLVIFLLLEA